MTDDEKRMVLKLCEVYPGRPSYRQRNTAHGFIYRLARVANGEGRWTLSAREHNWLVAIYKRHFEKATA